MMDDSSERMRILSLIESGEISTEEGLRQLAALQEQTEDETASEAALLGSSLQALESGSDTTGEPYISDGEAASQDGDTESSETARPLQPEIVSETQRQDFERWKSYWMIPLWVGVGITILGGMLMYWALQASHVGFWFFCATIPFILGVIIMVIGAESRTARWLHLRVHQAPGERPQNIAISFPIPIGLTIWFLRTFRYRIPGLDSIPPNIEDILYTMRDEMGPDNPVYIHVDDDEDGEHVEIFIG
jgi:hypothetical protein